MTTQHSHKPPDSTDLWTTPAAGSTRYNCPRCTMSHFATRDHQLAHMQQTHVAGELIEQLWEDIRRLDFDHPAVPAATKHLAGKITGYICPVCNDTAERWQDYRDHLNSHGAQALYAAVGDDLPAVIDTAPRYTALEYGGPAGTALQLLPGDRLSIQLSDLSLEGASTADELNIDAGPWTLTGLVETVDYDFRDILRPVLADPYEQPDATLADVGDIQELRMVHLTGHLSDDPHEATPWTLAVDAPSSFSDAGTPDAPPTLTLSQGLARVDDAYAGPAPRIVDATIERISRSPWHLHLPSDDTTSGQAPESESA